MENTKPTPNEAENGNKLKPLLCDVDYSQMDDNELLKIGLKLMRLSLRNLLNKDAKEHIEYERYMVELERRQSNIT
tara:strand:+ start:3371 stop:3598 length:228 start_codon:yes stop_codon:yes gene_type:complete